MKKNTKGFTLIELLAVIVILAIIALIAVPVIMNIINKANESAFKDTAYGIISAGELYYAEQQLEPKGMLEDVTFNLPDTTKTLQLKGEVPTGSIVITKEGKVAIAVQNGRYCVTKGIEEKDVKVTEDVANCKLPSAGEQGGNTGNSGSGEKTVTDVMVSTTNNCVISGKCTEAEIKTDEGIKVTINVKAGTPKDFYVLADDGEKVTLIMSENLGDIVEWYATTIDNSQGPTTALAELVTLTNDWTNIPEKTYVISGLGEDGTTQNYQDKEVIGRSRMITYAEANAIGCTTSGGSCPEWLYINLYGTGDDSKYGYWTSTAFASDTEGAWNVHYYGQLVNSGTDDTTYGLRPVITLSK